MGTFASLVIIVAIVAAFGVGLTSYLQNAATGGVRKSLEMASGTDVALRVGQPLADDAKRQDQVVRSLIATELRSPQREIPLSVYRTVATKFTVAGPIKPGTAAPGVTVASIPELEHGANLFAGTWPTKPNQVSIQAGAAAKLGLAIGDRLRLGSANVIITATWRTASPVDPRWLSDPLFATGVGTDTTGPIVVDEREWGQIGHDPQVYWTIVPDRTRIDAQELGTVLGAWPRFGVALLNADTGKYGFTQGGEFLVTAAALNSRVRAADALTPMILLTLALIAFVSVLELARLLSEVRVDETELLWSRGASAGGLARSTAIETVAASGLGAVLGGGAAVLAVQLIFGEDAIGAAASASWTVPLAAAGIPTLIFGIQTFGASQLSARRDSKGRSGRGIRVAQYGAVVLVALAAVVSVWQLRLYGTPVTPSASGGEVDLVTVLAPTLTLVTLVLGGLLLFPVVAPFAERLAARRLGAGSVLAARSVSRRRALLATPFLTVALACGQLVTAAGYSASWALSFSTAQDLRAGTPIRIIASQGTLDDATIDRIATVPGVTAVGPVTIDRSESSDGTSSLVGVRPSILAALSNSAMGTINTAGMAAAIDSGSGFQTLPGMGGTLDLSLATVGFAAPPDVSVWVQDDAGLIRRVPLETVNATPNVARYSAGIPSHSWRLAAVDVAPTGVDSGARERDIRLENISVSRGQFSLGGLWSVFSVHTEQPGFQELMVPAGFPIAPGPELTRLMPPEERRHGPIRVVVSTGFAMRFDISRGSTLTLDLNPEGDAVPVPAFVAGVASAVPAAPDEDAVLIDLSMLQSIQLRSLTQPESPAQFWVGATNIERVGSRIRGALPRDMPVVTPTSDTDRAMLGSTAVAVWIAAGGSAILALAAIGAVIGAQLRSRRHEVTILRAIGVASRSQGAIRRSEFAIVMSYAAVIGIISGAVTVPATMTMFARVAVPNPYASLPTLARLEPTWLPLALITFLVLVAAAVTVYGALVSRGARNLTDEGVYR